MKGFERTNPLFSLCGLNCGLCSMKLGGHCGGCGYGNQSCQLARCSMEHGNIEYCFACDEYPCPKYDAIDAFDSFITHKNQKTDMLKAQSMGIEAYNAQQIEKARLLDTLLSKYNSGREKTLYCLAVNLLALDEISSVLAMAEADVKLREQSIKEKAAYVRARLLALAEEKNIVLKLRKK